MGGPSQACCAPPPVLAHPGFCVLWQGGQSRVALRVLVSAALSRLPLPRFPLSTLLSLSVCLSLSFTSPLGRGGWPFWQTQPSCPPGTWLALLGACESRGLGKGFSPQSLT